MSPATPKTDIIAYRLDKLEERMKERDTVIVDALNRIDERFDDFCTRYDTRLSSLETGRVSNKTNIDGINKALDNVTGRVGEAEKKINTLSGLNALFTAVVAAVAAIFGR